MIRRAEPGDVDAMARLIYDLAEYEKARDQCLITAGQLRDALFGPHPALFAHVAIARDGAVVGMAIWFLNYSTWDGAHGIYLEDLYVTPGARGNGHGKQLLSALAQEAVTQGYSRVSWAVLNWNAPSIAFYESLGAAAQGEWITYRVAGPALHALAGSPDG
jgi:GNAT superfamily N-acetyltransferase